MTSADNAPNAESSNQRIPRRRGAPSDPQVAVVQVSPTLQEKPVPVATARYVLPALAHVLTGYTVKAMERKIERGDWAQGKVWIRAPDGRILIDIVGYHKWVEGR